MTTISITQSEVQELLAGEVHSYPKYATQLLNLANQNAQGTRPSVVGQMSELIQQFDGQTLQEWEEWYLADHPEAIDKATDRVFSMVEGLRSALSFIDRASRTPGCWSATISSHISIMGYGGDVTTMATD